MDSPATSLSPAAAPRKPLMLYGCAGLATLILLIAATVMITLWWLQRPIKPVVLAQPEWTNLQAKLSKLSPTPTGEKPAPGAENPTRTVTDDSGRSPIEADRPYTPGSKTLKISERELNGLIHKNTDLGENLRLELGQDAINAYLAVPVPEDFPVGGGRIFRARGRFKIAIGNDRPPVAILEDITVFGLSLPKAWLAGIKGENLLGDAMGEANGRPLVDGIRNLRVEPGNLVIEVAD